MLFIEDSFACFAEPNQRTFCDRSKNTFRATRLAARRVEKDKDFDGAVAMKLAARDRNYDLSLLIGARSRNRGELVFSEHAIDLHPAGCRAGKELRCRSKYCVGKRLKSDVRWSGLSAHTRSPDAFPGIFPWCVSALPLRLA